jgi:hypothetical protein
MQQSNHHLPVLSFSRVKVWRQLNLEAVFGANSPKFAELVKEESRNRGRQNTELRVIPQSNDSNLKVSAVLEALQLRPEYLPGKISF